MSERRVLRRIVGVGWQVEPPGGGPMLIRDDGVVLGGGPIVGTAEAAVIAGVRPQNFVRDWASRADFPRPVAELASGRIWREADVRAYVLARRRPRPGPDRLLEIARRVAWWDDPARTLARPATYLARVMGRGSAEEIVAVEAEFGRAAMRDALRRAPADLLGERARNYWEVVLGMTHAPPPPARVLPHG
ncbi:MAG: hypothetical protein ACKOTZ_01225 [Chloroflexota bacterium]